MEAVMMISERVAKLERTLEAVLAGESGWPPGLTDVAVKRLEASIDALLMTDDELRNTSGHYREQALRGVGSTSAALMIELARRSTLSAHQRMAEAVPRRRVG